MRIGIIGAGNVGGALAIGLKRKGHDVYLGVRDLDSSKTKKVLEEIGSIEALEISEIATHVDVLIITTPAAVVPAVIKQLGWIEGKTVIDATNSISARPEPYANAFEAIKTLAPSVELAKCFNSTGFENMQNPNYGTTSADMFMAGNSEKAKKVARQLALDMGFAECYDFGGDDKTALLEQFALSWINLAILQKQGRGIAFKVIKR